MPLSFSTRSSIGELWARFGSEVGHARQVADLALHLFDATRAVFGIPEEDRDGIEAACLLHDVAYGADPRHHGDAGARIVARHGLDGFSPETLKWVCALIQLHPAPVDYPEAASALGRHPEPRRRLYAAALLRIADALDYGHLQDASIGPTRVMRRTFQIGIRPGAFAGCIDRARRQAGLWRDAFPVGIDLRPLPATAAGALLKPELSLHEGIRRLLFLNFRILQENVEGARTGSTDEALHDLRIAIRRMRVILRSFRRKLDGTSAGLVDRDLQQLNRILGLARDLDVWVGFFSKESVAAQFTGHRLWPRFLAHQIELRRMQQATVRRQLHGARFAALQIRIGRLLRVELPALAAAGPSAPLAGPARRALAKCLKLALRLGDFRRSGSPGKRHRLRIALRRLRYLGNFFAPVTGPGVARLIRRAHAVERMLGEMRDADLVLNRILQEGPPPPRLLVRQLERIRKADADALDAAWTRLEDAASHRGLRRELKRA